MPRYLTDEDVYTILTAVYHHWSDIQHKALRDAIASVPTADVVKRKKGKWMHDGSKWKNRWVCSECGRKIFDEPTPFCPYCGADMREETDNDRFD